MGGTSSSASLFVLLNMLSDVLYRLSIRGRGRERARRRDWLLDDQSGVAPAGPRSARLYRGWLRLAAQSAGDARARHHPGAGPDGDRRAAARHARSDRARTSASALLPPLSPGHWLGTDEFGRDIWSRLVYGARITLYIVLLVTRDRAGLRPRWSARWPATSAAGSTGVLMRITDIFLAFPRLILALAFVAALGPGHRQCGPRDRLHRLAALCARRPGRDADGPPLRLHRRRAAAGGGRGRVSCCATSCRCACPR